MQAQRTLRVKTAWVLLVEEEAAGAADIPSSASFVDEEMVVCFMLLAASVSVLRVFLAAALDTKSLWSEAG